ncbi:MAG: hypothetical protein NXH75_05985 [Halobacteriovoraceae bacterium]|nr:hypothetical protein [Halobacteriovoraceae bacterium]
MRPFLLILFLLFLPPKLYSKEERQGWGLSLGEGTSNIRIGGRLQGIAEYSPTNGSQDLYLRRARVNLQYETQNLHLIYVELRNDNSNRGDSGERTLFIGDAFYEVPLSSPFLDNLTLFRSKVDVSYSQTSSSKNLINPTRARVSDFAANFIVHNRRANNIQLNGGGKSWTFQLAVSDGIQKDEVEVPFGTVTVSSIQEQSLTVGGKLRYYLWNPGNTGEKAELQETYYGKMKTLSVGFGTFFNNGITFGLSDGRTLSRSRQLYNFELSFAYNNFRFLSEAMYFKGDTLNLAQSRFGNSWGSYIRAEYIIGKLAPYFGLNSFKRDEGDENSFEHTQLIGINYYAAKKTRRYGLSFRNYEYGSSLTNRDNKEIQTYIMMDY